MKEGIFKVDNIKNELIQDPAIRAELMEQGALDKYGERTVSSDIVEGDIIKGRLLIPRGSKNKGPWLQDVGWPLKLTLPVDGCGIDEAGAELLTAFVKAVRPSVVFETGTHKGRSTKAIVEGLVFNNDDSTLTTVDMNDYGVIPGIFTEEEAKKVTQVIGHTPTIFSEPELDHVQEIEFANLDGVHDETIIYELEFVEQRMAKTCYVFIDNVTDDCFANMRAVLDAYDKYPKMILGTLCGTMMIRMDR